MLFTIVAWGMLGACIVGAAWATYQVSADQARQAFDAGRRSAGMDWEMQRQTREQAGRNAGGAALGTVAAIFVFLVLPFIRGALGWGE
jgi:hypothetical protein